MEKRISALVMLIAYTFVYIYFLVNGGLENNYLLTSSLFFSPIIIGTVIGFLVAREYGVKTSHGKSFLLLTIGILLLLLGEVTWVVFEYFLEIEPFPSLADAFYLLAYPFLFLGLLFEVRIGKINLNFKSFVLSLISFLGLGAVFFYAAILGQLDSEISRVENIISALYGIGDIILILGSLLLFLVVFEYRKGRVFLCWLWFLLNFIFMLAGDLLFNIFSDVYEESIFITALADSMWIMSYGLFAIGMMCFYSMLKEKRREIIDKLKVKN